MPSKGKELFLITIDSDQPAVQKTLHCIFGASFSTLSLSLSLSLPFLNIITHPCNSASIVSIGPRSVTTDFTKMRLHRLKKIYRGYRDALHRLARTLEYRQCRGLKSIFPLS